MGRRAEDVTDGQFLFELYCARCHTQGWSIFDPTVPDGTDVLGLAGGGGGSGGGSAFNLRDGATERRFGTGDAGCSLHQVEFVTPARRRTSSTARRDRIGAHARLRRRCSPKT